MRRSFQKPSPAAAVSNVGAKCQKCLKEGHWTADCTNERVYKPRPSRTALLFNPKLKLPEASLVKDDFIDEKQRNIIDVESVERKEEINEIPDAEAFAEQLIEEVKKSHHSMERKIIEEEEHERRDTRYRRRRSRSRSFSRSRSPPRYRSLSRSPQNRSKARRRSPSISSESVSKNVKKYTEYASDSDFSSDSDK